MISKMKRRSIPRISKTSLKWRRMMRLEGEEDEQDKVYQVENDDILEDIC